MRRELAQDCRTLLAVWTEVSRGQHQTCSASSTAKPCTSTVQGRYKLYLPSALRAHTTVRGTTRQGRQFVRKRIVKHTALVPAIRTGNGRRTHLTACYMAEMPLETAYSEPNRSIFCRERSAEFPFLHLSSEDVRFVCIRRSLRF